MLDWEILRFRKPPTKITKENVFEYHEKTPKRFCFLTTHPNAVKRITDSDNVGTLNMPFEESIAKIFRNQTGINYYQTRYGGFWAPMTSEEEYEKALEFKDKYSGTVFLRDTLDCSIALAVNIDNDDDRTEIGNLEYEAKFNNCKDSTDELISISSKFIQETVLYEKVKYICGIPASKPGKKNLPMKIAEGIANELRLTCLNDQLHWAKDKDGLKNLEFDEKWPLLEETGLKVGAEMKDKTIILVDDLYQSGQTMQFVAMKMKEAGAKRILGLAMVKSRNDNDNQ